MALDHKQRSITRSWSKKKKKIIGIVKLKNVLERLILHKSLLSAQKRCYEEYGDEQVCDYVAGEVKEGHFAVIAVDDHEDEPRQRFLVPLMFLEHPRFLELLEQAAEEYGFDHSGALMVPCRPSELRVILAEQ